MNQKEMYDLIEEHYRKNYRYLVNRCRGPSRSRHNGEDIVQEAYLRALKYWEAFKYEQDLNSWINGILKRCLIDKIREEKEHGSVFEGEVVADIQSKAFNRLVIEEVIELISEEPPNVQLILNLYFFEEYKTSEICEQVPETNTNIRQIIHNFRKYLRGKFKTRIFE